MILSPHVISGSNDAMRIVRDGKAPAVKLIGAYDKGGEFKTAGAKLVVARPMLNLDDAPHKDDRWRDYANDPVQFYFTFIHPHLSHPANVSVDAWETGVNEDYRKGMGETPDYADIELRAEFESVVARRIHAGGKIPIVGHFSVGTPSGTFDEQRRAWAAYRLALRTAGELGGMVGLHCYPSIDGWENPLSTLRDALNADNNRIGIVITECGHEPGYRGRGGESSRAYAERMIAFDRYLTARYGARIKAAFLFTYGHDNERWDNYDVQGDDVFNTAVIAYGQNSASPPIPPPPPSIEEPVLFTIPPTSLTYRLYPKPVNGVMWAAQRRIAYAIYVFETRDVGGFAWWRVTRKTSPVELWMRVGT